MKDGDSCFSKKSSLRSGFALVVGMAPFLVLSLCVMDLGMFVIGNGNLQNSHYYIIGGGMWICLVRKKIRLVGINKSYFFSSGATRILET